MGLTWLDFIAPPFQRGVDDNLIVYHVASSSHMESAVEVVRLALGSLSHDTWYARVHAEGSNERNRAAYAAIRAAAEHYNEAPVADEDLRQFALHLKFFPHDLDIEFCFEPLFRHPHCPEGFRQLDSEQVFFKFRSYRISPAARRAIEQSLQAAEQRAERPCKLVKLNAEIPTPS